MAEPASSEELTFLPALQRLDALLAHASGLAADVYGPAAATDPYRGLVIAPEEVERLLRRPPGEPLLFADDPAIDNDHGERMAWLRDMFGLTPFDLDLLILAIAPEIDLRYERLYAYLQDDATRKRPTVDLVLNLLCASAAERIERRSRFAPDAPLLRHRLLQITDAAQQPLLARSIRPDEQVLRFLLGDLSLDTRLDGCAQLLHPTRTRHELDLAPETWAALPEVTPARSTAPPRLSFEGPDLAGQRAVAQALAAEAGQPLLVVDLEAAQQTDLPLAAVLPVAFREAWFGGSALFLSGVDLLRDGAQAAARARLHAELAESRVLTLLAGRAPWQPDGATPTGVISIPFPVPPPLTRQAYWTSALATAEIAADPATLEMLAGQYRLTADQISDAVLMVRHRADWTGAPPQPADLAAAARAQSNQDLAASARKITPLHDWDALVLPEDALDQLRDLRNRVLHRQRVLGAWGFDQVLSLGRGVCALFAGPSGTGKTMAAEVLAGEIGLDLYKIDLATVVSKYIGETEKNLEAVFNAATRSNAILFFDEADAIFGKRSEVQDAHDRYANLEIAYLLQKMEQYDGVAILATNLRQNLDDAFLRRLHAVIEFPMPDEAHRERMWRQFLPDAAPVDPDIDYAWLARQFRLSGGNIKNIVVSAAYQAAANGGCITMPHLLRSTWREHQKIGLRISARMLDDYQAVESPPA